jgi:predicted metal-dependent phosphoesterase TrpH
MTSKRSGLLRADLHVHSYHSGYASHLEVLHARDCYSEPEAVYATAKARGMDIVTITDHDSIDGCLEFLQRHPDADDFFISEEIECVFPGTDFKVHIGAYDIDETIHREIQPLRRNVYDAAAYLRSRGVFYVLNHPFFFFKDQMALPQYVGIALETFPAFEVRNGTMLPEHNQLAEAIARASGGGAHASIATIAGSDSHTLTGIGTTYTEVPGTNRREFLANLRAGLGRPGGVHGSAAREAREIYGVVARYWASLVGVGRQELSWRRRAFGLAFSAVSMPFEFIPLIVAFLDKRGEAERVARYTRHWAHASRTARAASPIGESLGAALRGAQQTVEPL